MRLASSLQSMGAGNLLRYAWSELRARPITTAITTATVALSAMYMYVLGFDGSSIYDYQRGFVDKSTVTEVVAATPDITSRGLRFTPERVATVAHLPGVARAFPRVELNVLLANGERTATVPAEGTMPDDPRLLGERVCWGRGPTAADAAEIVLSRRLFEKLGGICADGPQPATVTLEVSRTVGGRAETQRVPLTIVGLVQDQSMDKAYIPLHLSEQLDRWCTGKIQSLARSEESVTAGLTYPWADAWVPVREEARVAEEAKRLNVTVSKIAEMSVITTSGRLWASISRADGDPLRDDNLRVLESFGERLQRVELRRWGEASVAILADADPRWRGAGQSQPAAFGTVMAAKDAGGGVPTDIVVRPAPREWPVGADLTCTLLTAQWAAFDPAACDGAERTCVIETQDLWAGAQIAALYPVDRWAADRETARLFLRPPLPQLLTDAEEPGVENAPLYWEGQLGIETVGLDGALAVTPLLIRLVPDAVFHSLAGISKAPLDSDVRPVLFWGSAGRWRPRDRLNSTAGGLEVLAIEEAPVEMIVAPESERLRLCPDALPAGRVLSGPWATVAEPAREYFEARWSFEAGTITPHSFTAFIPGTRSQLPAELRLVADRCTIREVQALTARDAQGPEPDRLLVGPEALGDEHVPDERIWIGGRPPVGGRLTLRTPGWTLPPLALARDRRLPAGVARVSKRTLRTALFHASTHKALPGGRTRLDVFFDDPVLYVAAARQLAARGLRLEPLMPVATESIVHYQVRDTEGDGSVRDDLIAVLAMSRPTFVAARGQLTVPGRNAAGAEITLVASDPLDPIRFNGDLTSGRWLSGEDTQVVLGRTAGAERSGGQVLLRFERRTETAGTETIELPFDVVGQSNGEVGYIPRALAGQIELWRRGKLVFNEARAEFMSPLEIAVQGGHVRCNVFAQSADAVPNVVRALREMGYQTQDRLAEQEGLRRLSRILVFVVGFFVLGFVISAAMTVGITTYMHVKNKTFEIGIMLAHGVRRRDAWGVFVAEGLGIGLTAFVLASLAIALVEPVLRQLTCQAFGLDAATMLPGSPFDAGRLWLPALTLGVCVLFSVLGVALPAWWACRLKPIDALRRRE